MMMRVTFNIFVFIVLFLSVISCKKKNNATETPNPVACFNLTNNLFKPNDKIDFANCSENANVFSWDFDDGTLSELENPSHQWSKTGVYTVNLNASLFGKQSTASKKIAIANTIGMDFTVLMKNFKSIALSDSFTCFISALDNQNHQVSLLNLKYPPVVNTNYSINFDLSGLYYGNNSSIKHQFKILFKNSKQVLDSLITNEIDIVESTSRLTNQVQLSLAEVNYSISLNYQ